MQGQNVVCFVVQLVGRPVTWCAGRAADSDTVVTVRTGLNFGADLCQDHCVSHELRPCQLLGGYHSGVTVSHGLIGPEVVFEG